MERLFPKDASINTKISYYHLLAFLASLPFDFFYSHLILISFCLHTLIQLNKKAIRPIFTWSNLALQSVFFVTMLSTIYTVNRTQAFNQWGTHITILLFPVLFCLTSFDIRKYRNQLLFGFSIVCAAVIVYLYLDALHNIHFYGLPMSYLFSSAFTNHNFALPIDIHATFFSLQVAIALIFMLSVILKEQNKRWRLFELFCASVLLAGLAQLSSKSVFIPTVVIIDVAVPFYLLKDKKRIRFIAIAGVISVIAIAGMFAMKSLHKRYVSALKYDLALTAQDQRFDSRLDRWRSSFGLIEKSPVIGYGAGSELGLLHEDFYTRKYYNSFVNHLNSHNQYLSFWLKSGIIGLLVYLITLAFGFKQALQKKDLLFLSFMLLIIVVSFAENLLDVDKGVVFYAFFFSFFFFSDQGKKNTATAEL
ncbi:O-antigen ligase family protein [Mucilaginibacter sp. dw_454]|uniref:O-antigen ligase family protein n=1 Tax=Mucilaginibacter sp. dw_454 TaxID=2720079 RepID=UPI001BD343ED|nr:O-antigen ligase family protein [Mucilaginibacter sp. dw_454]